MQREIDTPDGVRTARFERVQFAPKNTPEGYIQAARHLTPEYIYQPRYTSHANGCFELAETVLVALDMDATVNRYAVYTGLVPKPAAQTVRFELPQAATLTIVRAADAVAYLPGSLLPPLPGIAAVGFRTTDLDAVGERLRAGGFAVSRAAERLLVPAEEAGGVALLFGR